MGAPSTEINQVTPSCYGYKHLFDLVIRNHPAPLLSGITIDLVDFTSDMVDFPKIPPDPASTSASIAATRGYTELV
jgi:hypothetical protein